MENIIGCPTKVQRKNTNIENVNKTIYFGLRGPIPLYFAYLFTYLLTYLLTYGATSRSTVGSQNNRWSGLPRRCREGLEQSAAVDNVVTVVAPV